MAFDRWSRDKFESRLPQRIRCLNSVVTLNNSHILCSKLAWDRRTDRRTDRQTHRTSCVVAPKKRRALNLALLLYPPLSFLPSKFDFVVVTVVIIIAVINVIVVAVIVVFIVIVVVVVI